jgi:uncharacterized protein (DUF58 family)
MIAVETSRTAQTAESIAEGLSPLLVAAEHLAATVILGEHGRRRAGSGESFWQYRPYSFGDPTARIDWRRSGRSDRVFIRENEWEAANTLWLWTNTSARMAFQSDAASTTKKHRAMLLSLAMGSLALRAHERVGNLANLEPPSHGRTTLMRIAASMIGGPGLPLPETRTLRRGATALLISDFLDHPDDIAKSLLPLAAQKIRCHLVQVTDPAEETLPYEGRVEFTGLGNADRFLANRAQSLRQDYIAKFKAQRQAVRHFANKLGWSFTVHRTSEPVAHCLLSLHQMIADTAISRGQN